MCSSEWEGNTHKPCQDAWFVVEGCLDTIAVVGIEVQIQHPRVVFPQGGGNRDSRVVVDAESGRSITQGMVQIPLVSVRPIEQDVRVAFRVFGGAGFPAPDPGRALDLSTPGAFRRPQPDEYSMAKGQHGNQTCT
jgi:hypothetical protein